VGIMKHRMTFIALVVSLASASLVIAGSSARAQQGGRIFSFDTGVVTLGSNQVLRTTVAGGGDDTVRVRLRWMRYGPAGCGSDGACRQTVVSQGATRPESLGPADALHYDQGGPTPGVRVVAESNSRNVRVVFQIMNTSTGDITAIWVPQGSPVIDNQ
jgi:hypothetical protein